MSFIRKNKAILSLLVAALLLRLILSPFGTLELDYNNFTVWGSQIGEKGPSGFYQEWSDYLPGYVYVLWFLDSVKAFFPDILHLLFKLPAILADVVLGILIFSFLCRSDKKLALVASGVYLFNPVVFANSALWGQIDGIVSLFVFASVLFAVSRPILSSIALPLAVLFKPYAAIVVPIVAVLWARSFKWKAVWLAVLSVMVFALGFIPFADKSLPSFIGERLYMVFSQQITTGNAFNLWVLRGLWQSDAGWPVILGIALACASIIAVLFVFRKKLDTERFLAGALIMAASFLFFTRMHEHYLLPMFALLSVAATFYSPLWISYVLFSAVQLASIRFSYVWLTENFAWAFPEWAVVILSFINLFAFVLSFWFFVRKSESVSISLRHIFSAIKHKLSSLNVREHSERNWRWILAVILLFSLGTRLFMISQPSEYYFDEIYHSFTAREYLHGSPDAWVWYSTPPEGRAYDWVQPPMAKLLMASSMFLFGEHPFAWRLPGVLLGVGAVWFVFLIGSRLFNKSVGLLAAALFALDGLPLVLSRIGTNDSQFLFFTVATIYFFLSERYWLSALLLGFAASTKLSVLWIPPLIVILFFVLKKRWEWKLAWYLVLPPVVYLLSFVPFFMLGHTWAQLIELHQQMYWYHSHLQATHPFSSPWWSWPFMLKPIWFFTVSENGIISNIYAHGNPVVFWLGFAAAVAALFIAFFSKRRELWAVIIAYAALFVPWSLSPRIMFLYHYLPSVPFLCIILSWVLLCHKRGKYAAMAVVCLALLFFLFFYPRFVGIPMPEASHEWYGWLR